MKRRRLVFAALATSILMTGPSWAQTPGAEGEPPAAKGEQPERSASADDPLSPQVDPFGAWGAPEQRVLQPSAPIRVMETPVRRESTNPLLRLFDTDEDGVLSAGEISSAAARLWELDINGDGQLTPDELALVTAPRWNERRRAVQGVGPAEPAADPPGLPLMPGAEPGRGVEASQMEVYPLRSLDPDRVFLTLQQMLQGRPDARLTIDPRTGSLIALGPPDVHALVRKILADLLAAEALELPGRMPGLEDPGGMEEFPLGPPPRVITLYSARAREVLQTVRQVYRDRLFEPGRRLPAGQPGASADGMFFAQPVELPPDRMVIGVGADPNSIVVTAEDELFFEVLDLIERLDGMGVETAPEER